VLDVNRGRRAAWGSPERGGAAAWPLLSGSAMSLRARLRTLLAGTLSIAPVVSGAVAAPMPAPMSWQPAPEPAGAVVALAYEAGAARLAVADRAAVWVGLARGRLAPVHRARGVRDLAFARDGTLWIAGDDGLARWRDGASSEVARLGAGASSVHRLRRAGDRWIAAGVDGLHARDAAGAWARLDLALPTGPVTALAVAPTSEGVRIGAVIDGVAHWHTWTEPPGTRVASAPGIVPLTATGGPGGSGLLATPAPQRIGTPGEGPRSAVDVWLAPDGGEAWTLLRSGCLVGASRVCVPLPPGADASRLFRVEGRWWLTTGRGLLLAEALEGPWRRAPPPLGSLESHGIVGGGGAVFVGTERGLLVACAADEDDGVARPGEAPVPRSDAFPRGDDSLVTVGEEGDASRARAPRDSTATPGSVGLAPGFVGPALGAVSDLPPALGTERRDPPPEAVRRAALAYLDLGGARLRGLRRGPERRGWLPEIALRFDHDRFVARSDDYDEAFVSGDLRSLFDRNDDRSSRFKATLSFEWDLGDLVYHPESVDVSRETRELVELRDDVLDEIHHLYFERRRVLLELLALPEGQPFEAARLRLRADELAAGIDAWTGGWFSRHAVRLAP